MIQYEKHQPFIRAFPNKNMTFPLHLHQEVEILYVQKGKIDVVIQDKSYTLHPAQMAVIMPNTLHRYETAFTSESLILIFKPSLITYYQSFLSQQCTQPILYLDQLHPDVYHYFEELLSLEVKSDIGLVKGYLYLLFSRLVPHLTFKEIKNPPSGNLLYLCLEYIRIHFCEPITLDILAQYLGVSRCYLSHLFNRSIGYSLSHYLNMLRIDHAKYLLLETSLSVTDVSFNCGYETVRHFNRIFKEFTGTTPLHYRFSKSP